MPSMDTPLVTITFVNDPTTAVHGDGEAEVERLWHHVPRVGEYVEVGGDGDAVEPDIAGRVTRVTWSDTGADIWIDEHAT